MSASEHPGINAKGYNGTGDYGKQVGLMYVFQAKLSRPVYYRLINGNVTDISRQNTWRMEPERDSPKDRETVQKAGNRQPDLSGVMD
jgi:hypothetical protein